MPGPYRIEALGPHHDRAGFSSGVAALDRYLREQVTQDVRGRVTACYVAAEADTGLVAGYYVAGQLAVPKGASTAYGDATISAGSVHLAQLFV